VDWFQELKGLSENINVRSIVGRYLEHSRILIFANGGEEKYFISSADWMERNIDKRIEVTTPILDPDLQKDLKYIIEAALKGNQKARIIDAQQKNKKVKVDEQGAFNSQNELYAYFCEKSKNS
jgi:polyphosphate kinase